MEINCAICNLVFNSFRRLKSHMDFYHRSVVTYCCASPGCCRSYSLFNSYRRHYLVNHNCVQNNTDAIEPCHPIPQSLNSFTSQDINNDQSTDSETIHENQQTHTQSTNSLIRHNVSNIQPTVNALSFHKTLVMLGSKLYANPQVPQTVVDDVFNYVSELFNQILPCLRLEQSESIKAVMTSFDSLHKRLKYYEEVGTYIKPETYVVGTRYDFVTRNGLRGG